MYTYNHKISARANDSLRKRARVVQLQKQSIAIISIIIVSFLILLGSSISAFASAGRQKPLQKYYKSIQVENGDTLWTIADRFTEDGAMTKKEFIEEVSRLNHITDGEIYSGEDIVIVYYAASPHN